MAGISHTLPKSAPNATELQQLLSALREALARRSLVATPNLIASHPDCSRLMASIRMMSERVRESGERGGFIGVGRHIEPCETRKLLSLLNELSELRRVPAAMVIGRKHLHALKRIVATEGDTHDLLGIFRKEEDENAHSDVLRWLLDPSEAAGIAPQLLLRLVTHLSPQADWITCIERALHVGGICVRREVTIGGYDGDPSSLDRIDLVISGQGFVIGIENKVNAAEHEGQTAGYARWLGSIGGARTGGLFLSPSGVPAQSADFRPLSYLKLASYMLEVLEYASTASEIQVLTAYLRTLNRRILRSEFRSAISAWEHDESAQ